MITAIVIIGLILIIAFGVDSEWDRPRGRELQRMAERNESWDGRPVHRLRESSRPSIIQPIVGVLFILGIAYLASVIGIPCCVAL